MNNNKLFLKQNVLIEPLINQWYAWSYLVSPATAGMYIKNLHLKIMKSFINAPQVHISALKNPAMMGGPFINYDSSRVSDVKELMEKTLKEQAEILKFSEAIQTLDKTLINEAHGYSLESLYQKVPHVLKGYVELVYDLNNNPSFRLIEGLIYKSPYYQETAQSIVLSLINNDKRPFVFSTPRLECKENIYLKIPFNHEAIDELSKMKFIPQTLNYINNILKLELAKESSFSFFFSSQKPVSPVKYTDKNIRIRYFGHACICIETNDASILVDPVISYDIKAGIERYTYSDLPENIDYVLITHNHQDHCMFETLLQLRYKIKNIIVPKNNGGSLADPSLKLALKNIGFNNVFEIDEIETINIKGGTITGLPFLGEHADLNIKTKIAYLIEIKGKLILCLADSNNIEPKLYEHIGHLVTDIDVLFIGMECDGGPMSWLYGPLLTNPLERKMDQSRRFDGSNYEKAVDIVNQLKAKKVYVYAMGQEPWLAYLTSIQYTEDSRPLIESNKLVDDCRKRGIEAERLFGHKELFLGTGV